AEDGPPAARGSCPVPGDRRVRCRCGKGVQLACRCGVPAQRGRHLRRQRRRDPNRFHPGWRTDGAGTVLSGARPRALRRIADGPHRRPGASPATAGPGPGGDQCPASAAGTTGVPCTWGPGSGTITAVTEDGVPEFCVREVEVPVHSVSRLEPLIGKDRYEELQWAGALAHQRLDGRTVWNFSSTAAGGGVSEMLHVLVGYIQDVDVDIRWLVMTGDPEFYSITKRIHNRLHGAAGDAGDLGPEEAAHYDYVTASNLDSALSRIREGDVVLLHDPQTAGMAPALAEAGARVVWRCHVGREETNQWTDEAWSFLRPHLPACEAFIFSVREYAPWWIDESTIWVIPP